MTHTDGFVVPLDDEGRQVYRYYTKALQQVRWWEQEREELKAVLLGMIGDGNGASLDGVLVVRKIHHDGSERVDQRRLKQKLPEIYHEFVKYSQPYDTLQVLPHPDENPA